MDEAVDITERTKLLLGSDTIKSIQSKKVIVFGVGGVGGWCVESLVRSGIEHITIVDSDCVAASNINRQLVATTKTIGRPKVEVLKERMLEINPSAEINALQEIYSNETSERFHLDEYDYVIDCIDSLKNKINLLLTATKTKATVFSSMGAALKVDPTKIKTAEFWKVRGCPLGAIIRKRMRQSHVKPSKNIMCVYSEELLNNKRQSTIETDNTQDTFSKTKAQINGTTSHITAIFGFTLAGLVIMDITNKSTKA